MKAIKIFGTGDARLVDDVKLLTLLDDYVLIKPHGVALNPTDYKHVDNILTPIATVGCDYAGTVVKVGSKVTKSFKLGDRACSAVHGSNTLQVEDGAVGGIHCGEG